MYRKNFNFVNKFIKYTNTVLVYTYLNIFSLNTFS